MDEKTLDSITPGLVMIYTNKFVTLTFYLVSLVGMFVTLLGLSDGGLYRVSVYPTTV